MGIGVVLNHVAPEYYSGKGDMGGGSVPLVLISLFLILTVPGL